MVQVAWKGSPPGLPRATAPQPFSGAEEPSAKNATVPPPSPVTVAVNITAWPASDGFTDEDTVVALTVSALTVWPPARVPLLAANLVSPE